MTREEFKKLADALKTYYPRENFMPNPQALELWFRQLQDLEYMVAEAAIQKWVATSKWTPTVADIREMALDVTQPMEGDWSTGWEKVQRLIRAKGSYATQKDMEEALDEISLKAVRALGWQKICGIEGDPNPDADRANFRIIYEAEQKRQRETAKMPQRLRDIIHGIIEQHKEVAQIDKTD